MAISKIKVGNTEHELQTTIANVDGLQTALDSKSSTSHTHKYAGSSNAGGAATSANKLNTNAGSTTQPVYFSNGVPVKTTYTLGASVPSDAKFTDSHYASKNIVGSSTATSNTTSALTNGNVYLNSVENGVVTSAHKISGSGAATVTSDASGNIIVSATNTTYSAAGSSLGLVKSGGDVTISSGVITVNDDSHNHVISNVDGLQTALDGISTELDGSIKGLSVSGKVITYTKNDGTTGTITTQDTNTTYSNMTAATSSAAGKAGLVPAPAAGKQASFLRGDGTWVVPTNTTYSNFVKSGSSAKAGLVPAPSTTAGTTKYLREDGTWATPPNTTYSAATTSANGLMSASDKTKLDGITASADSVSFTQSLTSGTKVGTITINGTATDLYCQTNTNTDTKVTISANAPTSQTAYYPTMYTSTSGTTAVTANANTRFSVLTGTTSAEGNSRLILGNATAKGTADNATGKILLYSENTSYHTITPASTSSAITHTLPATSGTVLNTGTTSFTQSLTSGTTVGTLKINGTSTTLYAPTNTDTKNTAGSTDSSSKLFLIGATSQAANPQTYSHDTAYVGTDGHLYSNSSQVVNLATTQTISAVKTFSSGIKIGSASLTYDSTNKRLVISMS